MHGQGVRGVQDAFRLEQGHMESLVYLGDEWVMMGEGSFRVRWGATGLVEVLTNVLLRPSVCWSVTDDSGATWYACS